MKKQVIANQSLKKERNSMGVFLTLAPGERQDAIRAHRDPAKKGLVLVLTAACVGMRDEETAKDIGLRCVVVFLIQLKL